MPTIKLTSKGVENAKPEPGKDRTDYFDAVLPGFSLRVTKSGSKSWVVYYRSPVELDRNGNPKSKRFTIGKYPRLGLADAREEASGIMRRVEEGEDPQREKVTAKQQVVNLSDPVTVADGVARYVDEHVKLHCKYRTKADGTKVWALEELFNLHVLPFMGGMRIEDVTRKDVLALQRYVEQKAQQRTKGAKTGSTTAGHAAGAIRTVFRWLEDAELADNAPIIRLKNKKKTQGARVLTDAEIRTIWGNLDKDSPFGVIVRILLLTGQRRSEVAGMRWEELDLDAKVWSLPKERTKNSLPHLVPLSDPVIEMIKSRERIGEFVFTSTGTTPFSGFSRSKARLDGRTEFSDWTLHDLRRTFVTRLYELNIPPHIVETAVNHISGEAKVGVAGVYNKAQHLPERKAALECWATALDGMLSLDGDNVIALH